MNRSSIQTIFGEFQTIASNFEVEQLTSGHINHTFLVRNGSEHYALQKLNTHVFKNLEVMMQNMQTIATQLTTKKYPHRLLEPLFSKKGKVLVQGCWRLFHFFENTQSFEKVLSATQAFSAAQFLSEFHRYLIDLNPDNISDSIPGFLDFNARDQQFQSAIQSAPAERLQTAKHEIEQIRTQHSILEKWNEVLQSTPKRIIHADPKISNFLFRESAPEQIVALIDWDTFMSGPILYDFGDMARSYTNLRNEDDPNPGKVFSKENYLAIKKGFLFHIEEVLSPQEIENMDLAAKTVVYVQAIRFLTDYLNQDRYYAVHYPDQNLNRTKNQLNLLKEMISL